MGFPVRIDPEAESKMKASGKRSAMSFSSVNDSDSSATFLHLRCPGGFPANECVFNLQKKPIQLDRLLDITRAGLSCLFSYLIGTECCHQNRSCVRRDTTLTG
jgi:hypothetical protein